MLRPQRKKIIIACISLLAMTIAITAFAETIGQKIMRLRREKELGITKPVEKTIEVTVKTVTTVAGPLALPDNLARLPVQRDHADFLAARPGLASHQIHTDHLARQGLYVIDGFADFDAAAHSNSRKNHH